MRVSEQKVKRKKPKRIFTWIVVGCLLLAGGLVITLKTCELKQVTITGSVRYSEEEIKQLLMTGPTDHITFLFWLRSRLQDWENIPFIEKIELEMTSKNSVEITIYEKLVTGCVEQMGSYLYFDREGRVVESSRQRLEDIPLVTGLKFSHIVLQQPLQVQREELFEVILNLVRLIEKQELTVEEIHFNSEYEVSLMIADCEVLLGKRRNYDEVIAVLRSVLASAEGRRLCIDMSNYENGNGRITAKSLEDAGDE